MYIRGTYYSPDSAHDLSFLYSNGVVDFVHFTQCYNLPTILQEGLLPRAILNQKDIKYYGTDSLRLDGNNAINLSITNPNINLFFAKRTEIEKNGNSTCFVVLTLDPALLSDVESKYEFRRENAAKRDSQPCNVEGLFDGDRPSYFMPNWTTDNQAEIRVMDRIDPRRIKTIQFPYDFYSRFPSMKQGPEALAWLARELDLQLEVMLCDRHFYYYKAPIKQQCTLEGCFECQVIHSKKGATYRFV